MSRWKPSGTRILLAIVGEDGLSRRDNRSKEVFEVSEFQVSQLAIAFLGALVEFSIRIRIPNDAFMRQNSENRPFHNCTGESKRALRLLQRVLQKAPAGIAPVSGVY